jgi:hypothetical protein
MAKPYSSWHGRAPSEPLAITVFTLPEEQVPEVTALTSLSQARYFEEVVRQHHKEHQEWLEQNQQKPRTTEKIPDYIDWSRSQKLVELLEEKLTETAA